MNIAQLVQSQTLATLLQALQSASDLVPGKTVEARLVSLDGNGHATAQVGDTKIALVLAGPEAKQAALEPGATLVLRLDKTDEPGGGLRATLVETRASSSPSSTPTPATSQVAAAQPGIPGSSAGPAVTSQAALPGQPGTPRATIPAQGPATPGAPLPPALTALAAQQARLDPAPQATSQPVAAQSAAIVQLSEAAAVEPVGGQLIASQGDVPRAAPAQPHPPAAAPAASPRMAAGPLLGPALAHQDGLAPLFANLRSVSQGAVMLAVPRPLLTLIDRVLAQAVPVESRPLTPQLLKDAVQRSGLFSEARQATGQIAPPGADLKADLVALRDTLTTLLGRLAAQPEAKAPPASSPASQQADPANAAPRPTPPRRDGPIVPQSIAESTFTPGEKPVAVAQTLLEQTEAALDRVTLSQFASLPLDGPRADQSQGPRWMTEIPLAFQAGTGVMPLQIEKEPPRRDAPGVQAPLWRLRFALDVEPMGPLQGTVTLQGRSVGVTLWAEREETSRMLRGASPGLEAALVDAHFENGTIDVHTGQPRVAQAAAGQFLDRMS